MGIRDDLIARRDDIGTELTSIKNTDRHWVNYKQGLYDELKSINELLEDPMLDSTSGDGGIGPFEFETTGFT